MKEFLEFILKEIVKNPDQIEVEEEIEGTLRRYNICAAKDDMGLIIGKEGKTIRSIRAIMKAKAIKEGIKIYINVC